jgi:hypothetical protein
MWLNPKTLTNTRGQTLPDSHIYIDNSIFNQGITHTLRRWDWDAEVIHGWCSKVFFIACTNFLWQLNPKTLTQVKGQTLPDSHIWIDKSVFNQGSTHTLGRWDWDTQVIPEWCPKVFLIPAQRWFYLHQINNLFLILFVWGFNQCWSVLAFSSRFSFGLKNWTLWVEAGQDLAWKPRHTGCTQTWVGKSQGLIHLAQGPMTLFTKS